MILYAFCGAFQFVAAWVTEINEFYGITIIPMI